MLSGRKASVLVVALVQTLSMFKWGAWWMGCMTIGAYSMNSVQYHNRGVDVFPQAFALGIGFRLGLHVDPDSKGLYISEYLFVILSVRFVFQLAPLSRL